MIEDNYTIENIMRDVFRMNKNGRLKLIHEITTKYCVVCGDYIDNNQNAKKLGHNCLLKRMRNGK